MTFAPSAVTLSFLPFVFMTTSAYSSSASPPARSNAKMPASSSPPTCVVAQTTFVSPYLRAP